MLNVQKVRLRFIFARALYLYRLFQKAYGEDIIYCVATRKLILNVSKIRLRLIFVRALYLYRLFQKANGEFIWRYAVAAKN